jgi:hypothetical protein
VHFVTTQGILATRFLSISALLFLNKRSEAFGELKELIMYYKLIPQDYERSWNYDESKNFITNTDKLSESDKTLLFTLIDILESPKSEADRKLEALEASLAEMFTEKEK